MIERVKVNREKLEGMLAEKGHNWSTAGTLLGKSRSYFPCALSQHENELPVSVVDYLALKLGIAKEDFVVVERTVETKVQPRDSYDDIYVAVNDALADALTSDAFQKAMFLAIHGALKLHRKELQDDSV